MVQAVAKILNVSDQDEIKQINQTLSPLLVNAVSSTGNLALMIKMAEEGADFGLVDYRGRGPIHVAAISGEVDIVKFLIDQGVNLDHVDQSGLSPLYLACYHRNYEIADLLIKRGATVQVPVTTLARQLCQAGFDGDLEYVELLIRCEVDLNLSDYDRRTLGHLAACEGRKDMLLLLAEKTNFDFNFKDRFGRTTLDEVTDLELKDQLIDLLDCK